MSAQPQTRGDAPILGHRLMGQGEEKVIALHDWTGAPSNYEPMLAYLDFASFTWSFADLRGYGESRGFGGAYTVEEAAGDVFRLADALGWERFHLVGHSMRTTCVPHSGPGIRTSRWPSSPTPATTRCRRRRCTSPASSTAL